MKKTFLTLIGGALLVFTGCSDDDNAPIIIDSGSGTANFTVTIENVVTPQPIFQSGVFNTPVGAAAPAPLFPGDAYEFTVDAGPVVVPGDGGTRLSFVAMFVQSNDLFFAPGEEGIALYEDGNPIGANGPQDVTDQVLLWDAGTEVNEATGGPNQKPQQEADAEDQGVDENGVVTEITDNIDAFGNTLPDNDKVIQVTIENIGPAQFKVRMLNVSDATTIEIPGGASTTAPVPVSPGIYAVHTAPSPFFVKGEAAAGSGLITSAEGVENIAEDGFPEALLIDTQAKTGLIVPLSPGAYAVHEQGVQPIYQINSTDLGEGLEGIAEDGAPTDLATALKAKDGVSTAEAFNTPVGAADPGPLGPGASYSFSFTASDGENLSLATMFVQSNDWFYAFAPDGLPLFNSGQAVSGDATESIFLYDSGTEVDEYPGAGLLQVIRQGEVNSGEADEDTNVRLVDPEAQPNVPATNVVIKVTITSVPS